MQTIGTQKKQGSIVEAISQAILSGQIPAGTEMTQNELAESLGVSRMPVREALIILEYQGLIQRLPNNHVKTADLNEDYLSHIFHLCADLEADILTTTNVTAISKQHILDLDCTDGSIETEIKFHEKVRLLSPHPLHRQILKTMIDIYISYALRSKNYDTKSGLKYISEIIDNLHIGKDDLARKADSQVIHDYFKKLSDAAVNERSMSICSD